MGDISSVTERQAYRLRNRNRRQVVAECTPDNSGDGSYGLSASDVGLASIESAAFETPVINSGDSLVTWNQANTQFDVFANDGTGNANAADLSGETIVVVVTGPEE
jgi:hypothetical protein